MDLMPDFGNLRISDTICFADIGVLVHFICFMLLLSNLCILYTLKYSIHTKEYEMYKCNCIV